MRDQIASYGIYVLVGISNMYFLPQALGVAGDPNRSVWALLWSLGGAVVSVGAAVAVAMWSVSGD